MPSLAALPQQTDADLLRPHVLANDQPYAVAGGYLPVPVPQRLTCAAARQASTQLGLHPRAGNSSAGCCFPCTSQAAAMHAVGLLVV